MEEKSKVESKKEETSHKEVVSDKKKNVSKKDNDKTKNVRKKKGKKAHRISKGKVFIKSTYNNTIVSVADINGNVIGWSSAGHMGFKGPKKATPYAAMSIVKDVIDQVRDTGLSEVDVFVKGIGGGREAAIRAIGNAGLEISAIMDQTPIPHNGCRPKKIRRV